MSNKLRQQSKLADLVDYIKTGINNWTFAGKIIVDLIDNDKITLHDIVSETKIPIHTLSNFERLGRKTLSPSLLLGGFPAASRMLALPYSEQLRLETDFVEVLVQDKSGEWTTILQQPKNLTSAQSAQVFYRGIIRDLGAQRAYIESERAKKDASKIKPLPWHIADNEVVFRTGTKINATELALILRQLKKAS